MLIQNIKSWPNEHCFIALDTKSPAPIDPSVAHFIQVGGTENCEYSKVCPTRSYSRKNIAFLEAARAGASFVFETDDDNAITDFSFIGAAAEFFLERDANETGMPRNIFSELYDTEDNIWARGFPIRFLDEDAREHAPPQKHTKRPGVAQFLVTGNPDVDAIFRLVKGNKVDLDILPNQLPAALFNTYHPFNSQSTLWPREYFPLTYLPSTCSFRMTDIYRGYIAQRILYEHDRSVVFCPPNVHQIRNEHRISKDFFDEHTGYQETEVIVSTLAALPLTGQSSGDAMLSAYKALVELGIFEAEELNLLSAFLSEMNKLV